MLKEIRFLLTLIYDPILTKNTILAFLYVVISWNIIRVFSSLMFDIE
jgi:hypothetical protein